MVGDVLDLFHRRTIATLTNSNSSFYVGEATFIGGVRSGNLKIQDMPPRREIRLFG